MFIPYRVIQLKQKSKKYYKNADINTILDTQQLFQNCQTAPIQKFSIHPSRQISPTKISLDIKGNNKNNIKINQNQAKNKNKEYEILLKHGKNKNKTDVNFTQNNKIKNQMKVKESINIDSNKYCSKNVTMRHKNQREFINTQKSMSISLQNENINKSMDRYKNLQENLVSFSLDLTKMNDQSDKINSNIQERKFKSIQLNRKQRPSTTHKKNKNSEFQYNNNTIDYNQYSRSMSMTKTRPSMFQTYMSQLRRKRIQKQVKNKGSARRREETHPPIKITTFNNINNRIIVGEQTKKIQEIYNSMRKCEKMYISGRSIDTSKLIKCLNNQNGNKCECKQQNKKEKRNNCLFSIKTNDQQQIQIRAWKYTKNFDNLGIQEIQQFI